MKLKTPDETIEKARASGNAILTFGYDSRHVKDCGQLHIHSANLTAKQAAQAVEFAHALCNYETPEEAFRVVYGITKVDLGTAMQTVWDDFVDDTGHIPSAFELTSSEDGRPQVTGDFEGSQFIDSIVEELDRTPNDLVEIFEPKDLRLNKMYWCTRRDTGYVSVNRCHESCGLKFLGNSIWATDDNPQAFKVWEIHELKIPAELQ